MNYRETGINPTFKTIKYKSIRLLNTAMEKKMAKTIFNLNNAHSINHFNNLVGDNAIEIGAFGDIFEFGH